MTINTPALPNYTQDMFAEAFLRLLPQGPAWNIQRDSTMRKALYPLSKVYAENEVLAQELLYDLFPTQTVQTIPEWDETLGLPGGCAALLDIPQTIPQQQGAIVKQLTSSGGCSMNYFIDFAAALGYVITINEYEPLEDPFPVSALTYGQESAFIWTVKIVSGPSPGFLDCELRQIAPAHLMLYVIYPNGTVHSPTLALIPTATATVANGVTTVVMNQQYIYPIEMAYSTGIVSGTVVFPAGNTVQTVG